MTDRDRGQISVFTLLWLPILLALAGLVYDGGTALNARTRALGVAESAARAGAQQLDLTDLRAHGRSTVRLSPPRARTAALAWLHAAGMTGTAQATTTRVVVTVTATVHTRFLTVVGVSTLTVHATGIARPDQHPQP